MLTLYHNALSTCSQKVRMALAEKQLEFTSQLVDLVGGEQHAPDFVALSPKHVVPLLIADGTVLRESSIINEYLDTLGDAPSLIPHDPLAQAQMRLWVRRIDDDIHGKTSGVLTHAIWTRKAVGIRPADEIEAYLAALPDMQERELRRDLIGNGVRSSYMQGAIVRMAQFIGEMNETLEKSQWLMGDALTLADIAVMPYILRVRDTGFAGFWTDGQRPAVARWLRDIQTRPSFRSAVTEWVPDDLTAILQSFANDDAERIETLIRAVQQQG